MRTWSDRLASARTLWPWGRRLGPIGLELRRDGLQLAQWELGSEGPELRAATRVPHGRTQPDARELRELLATARDTTPVRGRRVVSSVPREDLRLMVLNYRLDAGQTPEQQIVELARERLRSDLSDYVIDYVPIRTTGEKHGEKSALLAAARQERVSAYLELLRAAGLEVEGLEIGPTAIRRLISAGPSRPGAENILILDFDEQRTDLMILWGRRLILFRELEFGEAALARRLAEALDLEGDDAREVFEGFGVEAGVDGLDEEDALRRKRVCAAIASIAEPALEALADQIDQALSYAASQTHGAEIEHLCLLGRISSWVGVEELVSQRLDPRFELFDPLAGIARESGAGASLAIAAGLGLRGLGADA